MVGLCCLSSQPIRNHFVSALRNLGCEFSGKNNKYTRPARQGGHIPCTEHRKIVKIQAIFRPCWCTLDQTDDLIGKLKKVWNKKHNADRKSNAGQAVELLYPIFRKALPFRVIRVSQIVIRVLQNVTILITYMEKFLHSDWLRAVQFFFLNSAEKS